MAVIAGQGALVNTAGFCVKVLVGTCCLLASARLVGTGRGACVLLQNGASSGFVAGHKVVELFNSENSWLGGLKGFTPRVTFQDKSGRYWIGSARSVQRYEAPGRWWVFGTSSRDPRERLRYTGAAILPVSVRRIAQSGDSRLWFSARLIPPACAAEDTYVSSFDGERWERHDPFHDRTEVPASTGLFQGQAGQVWFWRADEILAYDGRSWSPPIRVTGESRDSGPQAEDHLRGPESRPTTRRERPYQVNDGISDHAGCIWLSTLRGVVSFDPKRRVWSTSRVLARQATGLIYEDRQHRIWVGDVVSQGISVYDPTQDSVRTFVLATRLPAGSRDTVSPTLTAVYQDRSGAMLFGIGKWLISFSEATGAWEAVSASDIGLSYGGVPGDIEGIIEDHIGRIWVTTTQGIAVLAP
jgi:hypothetical protein